jgi:hypothetical protein
LRRGPIKGYVAAAHGGSVGAVHQDVSDYDYQRGQWKSQVFKMPEFEKTPIQKRTEEQRLDSMTHRLVAQYEQTGIVPASILEDMRVEMAKAGRMDITADVLRAVAAKYLNKVERKNKN